MLNSFLSLNSFIPKYNNLQNYFIVQFVKYKNCDRLNIDAGQSQSPILNSYPFNFQQNLGQFYAVSTSGGFSIEKSLFEESKVILNGLPST